MYESYTNQDTKNQHKTKHFCRTTGDIPTLAGYLMTLKYYCFFSYEFGIF